LNRQFNNLTNFVFLSVGGTIGSLIFFLIQSNFLQYIEEFSKLEIGTLLFFGFSIAITIFFISLILNKINFEKKSKLPVILFFSLILLGIFFGLYYFSENTPITWLFLAISFGLWMYIGSSIFYRFSFEHANYKMSVGGGAIGGIIASIFVSLAFAISINFSIDEGYYLLTFFSLSLFGFIVGITIFVTCILGSIATKNKLILFSAKKHLPAKQKIISIFVIMVMLFSITAYKYWDSMNLNDDLTIYSTENTKNLFDCVDLSNKNETRQFKYNSDQLIEFLDNKEEKDLGIIFQLYFLSNSEKYANEFRNLLLTKAMNKEFVGVSGSVKAWQSNAMYVAYYYLLASNKDPDIFSPSEKDLIVDWFKEINEHAYRIGWVDYVYGFIFKKVPDGPYENQEIGVGLLSVLSEILKEKYPELAKKNMDYIEQYGIGWKKNFRNPDDNIVYAHHIWQKNAFMMSEYGGHENAINNENSKNSFDWVLIQWPSNGMSPAYNVKSDYTPFDTMILGSYLHDDGRYLWLAEKMLDDEIKNPERKIGALIGLEYLQYTKSVEEPTVGTCYMIGPTGIAQKPGPLKPDKIVFRDGWKDDSLYALLNLRFSGWHAYKATNSIVTIMYGEPFIVEELNLIEHSWLPKGKADHRDKKINREELNGFIIESKGIEELIKKLTGTGSAWHQDPPKFAEVSLFSNTEIMDLAKTRISDWHGWTHDRVSMLVKDDYFVVFDHAQGNDNRKRGLTWNLKGNVTFSNNSVELNQGNYSVVVHYPHSNDDYQVKIINKTDDLIPAGKIHNPDTTLFLLSEKNSNFGSVTVIIPDKGKDYAVEKIFPLNNMGEASFPNALGVEIKNTEKNDLLGVSFDSNAHSYKNVKTDAETFLVRTNSDVLDISFNNAEFFEIRYDIEPSRIELNGNKLSKKDWSFSDNTIIVSNITEDGNLKIILGE